MKDLVSFRETRGYDTGTVQVKKLNAHAKLPTYGSAGAAGMDLYANFADMVGSCYALQVGERKLFKTGISIEIPRHTYARVAPRSGLAFKSGIHVLAGVIDEDYRGEVGVILQNLGYIINADMTISPSGPFIVSHGDRVAQLIIEKYLPCFVTEVTEHSDTARGAGAFGSTGK